MTTVAVGMLVSYEYSAGIVFYVRVCLLGTAVNTCIAGMHLYMSICCCSFLYTCHPRCSFLIQQYIPPISTRTAIRASAFEQK